jgi:hypothetical protein
MSVMTPVFLITALFGDKRSASRPGRKVPPVLIAKEASSGPQNRSGGYVEVKILYLTGDWNPDHFGHSERSQSLCRLNDTRTFTKSIYIQMDVCVCSAGG